MARLTGLEPATPGVTGRYSNQLSYNRPLRAYGPLPAKRCTSLVGQTRGVKRQLAQNSINLRLRRYGWGAGRICAIHSRAPAVTASCTALPAASPSSVCIPA